MLRKIIVILLSLHSVMIFSVSQLQLVDTQTGVVSSVTKLLEFNAYTKSQFSSRIDGLNFVENELTGGISLQFSFESSNSTVPSLSFFPGVFLYEKTKFGFTIQSSINKSIEGHLDVDLLSGDTITLPVSFLVTSVPKTVEFQLKGLPVPIDEIEKVHWILKSEDSEIINHAQIMVSDIVCFSDTTKVTERGLVSRTVFTPILFDTISTTSDVDAPLIDSLMFDNKEIADGDYISSSSTISMDISDFDSGVSAWSMSLYSYEDDSLEESSGTQNVSPSVNGYSGQYEFEQTIDDGQYYLRVFAKDVAGNISQESSPYFLILNEKIFQSVVFGPSPFNPNLGEGVFNYELTQDAEIEVSIFSISGEELWHVTRGSSDVSGGSTGFNEIAWDGRDKYGELVGNGPCIAYLIARFNGKETTKKVKIMVLK
jgi:hypothetical protein